MCRYFFVTISLLFFCRFFSQDSSKIYYEVFRNNTIYKSDSILVKKRIDLSNPFDLSINKYEIIHIKPGDSLWMYLLYPLGIIKYSSFHNSNFADPWVNISEPPYQIEMNYTTGGSVIRDKFSDSLTEQDTLLYLLREFPNDFLYWFLVQFDKQEINAISVLPKNIFNIFPNPSNGEFYLRFDDPFLKEGYQIQVLDAQYRLVYERQEVSSGKNKIDIQILDAGVYYVEIRMKDSLFRQKIIKQ